MSAAGVWGATNLCGVALSVWVREQQRKTALKEFEDLGLPVAFLDRLSA